ncbi:synaptosomal-associated protein 29-like [Mizuhopecten yessoensis]|uniref:Synaptosomal-associated protein 29 n=1 Tax=Mizuhopecten yessoensis TaxID=6573 RepID=A0A210QCX0_MIZYE|nr:synaptosomal-associated protein 29-like [Mizuhopecten yessoensis]OWF46561.1 Synaptosomal-associated protein 29 [Mizuhopecten yessoensis]
MANPFLDEDEISGPKGPSNRGYGELEDGRRNVLEQINASEDRQLESTRRALSSLYDSERMGVATAEELTRQGEQLNNIEGKVTDIDKNMTTTQKHLNSIKSVFGGIKNWWSTKKEDPSRPEDETSTRLKVAMENQGAPLGAEAGRRRPDTSGFGDEDELDSQFMAGSRKSVSSQGYGQASGQQILQPVTGSSREEETNDNLGLMSDGMSRLKDLALGLGDEISRQNDQLDRIAPKVDNVNVKVEDQNRQMRRILHK